MFNIYSFLIFFQSSVLYILYRNAECRRLASSSKDCTVRVWDIVTYQSIYVLSSHTASVTCVKWGGSGLIYSSSQDRTIRVWRAQDVSFFSYLSTTVIQFLIYLL